MTYGVRAPFVCRRVLVDAYNVLHAVLLAQDRRVGVFERVTGGGVKTDPEWWLPAYQARVVQWAERLATTIAATNTLRESDAPNDVGLTLVFDAAREVGREERVTSDVLVIVYAPNADDWIVDACGREHSVVITADRALANRARTKGAVSVKPWLVEEYWDLAPKCVPQP
jgi:hypothetical protein